MANSENDRRGFTFSGRQILIGAGTLVLGTSLIVGGIYETTNNNSSGNSGGTNPPPGELGNTESGSLTSPSAPDAPLFTPGVASTPLPDRGSLNVSFPPESPIHSDTPSLLPSPPEVVLPKFKEYTQYYPLSILVPVDWIEQPPNNNGIETFWKSLTDPDDEVMGFKFDTTTAASLQDYAQTVIQEMSGSGVQLSNPTRTTLDGREALIISGSNPTIGGVFEQTIFTYITSTFANYGVEVNWVSTSQKERPEVQGVFNTAIKSLKIQGH